MKEYIEEKLKKLVSQNKLSEAITLAEGQMLLNPISDFADAIGKNLLHITDDLVDYLNRFFAGAENEIKVQSLYAEMNGFTINCDLWYVDLFAFDRDEGLDDTDWLADYNYSSATSLPITGLENIQAVYADYMEKWEDEAGESAAQECAALIVLRVQELFKAAREAARARNLEWAATPIYVAAHDSYFDLIYQA